MKLFHLSDLHLGKRVNEFSMLEDQQYILSRILEWVHKEKPDVLILAGDIYDKAVPSAEAVSLFDWFLTELADRACPVCIVSGKPRFGRAAGIRRQAYECQKHFSVPGL